MGRKKRFSFFSQLYLDISRCVSQMLYSVCGIAFCCCRGKHQEREREHALVSETGKCRTRFGPANSCVFVYSSGPTSLESAALCPNKKYTRTCILKFIKKTSHFLFVLLFFLYTYIFRLQTTKQLFQGVFHLFF